MNTNSQLAAQSLSTRKKNSAIKKIMIQKARAKKGFHAGNLGVVLAKKKPKKFAPADYKFYQTLTIRKSKPVPKTKLPTHLMVKARNSKEAAEIVLDAYREHVEGKTQSIKVIKVYLTIPPKKAGLYFPVHPAVHAYSVVNGRLSG